MARSSRRLAGAPERNSSEAKLVIVVDTYARRRLRKNLHILFHWRLSNGLFRRFEMFDAGTRAGLALWRRRRGEQVGEIDTFRNFLAIGCFLRQQVARQVQLRTPYDDPMFRCIRPDEARQLNGDTEEKNVEG